MSDPVREPIVNPPLPPGTAAQSDLANAERFACWYGDQVCWVPGWGWTRWDTGRWQHGPAVTVMDVAHETARRLILLAAGIADEADRRRGLRWAEASQHEPRLRAMVALAEALPRLRVEAEAFDRDPFVLNTPSGIVDLRTEARGPHAPAARLTKLTGAPYDPAASCPRWEMFITEVFGDAELVAYVQRALGYSITGSTAEEKLFLPHGGGSNGKSLMLETVADVLGDYAQTVDVATLTARRQQGHSEDLAVLNGARFVLAIETNERQRLNEALVKRLTSGDRLRARFPYARHSFEFRPVLKLWLAVNHLPRLSRQDEAVWRRVHRLPFAVEFSNDPDRQRAGARPAADRDELRHALRTESPGILRWLIRGAGLYLAGKLGTPPAIRDATEVYRRGEDQVRRFVAERCVREPAATADIGELFRCYGDWYDEQDVDPEEEPKLTATMFGTRLKELGYGKTADKRQRQGLRLRAGVDPALGSDEDAEREREWDGDRASVHGGASVEVPFSVNSLARAHGKSSASRAPTDALSADGTGAGLRQPDVTVARPEPERQAVTRVRTAARVRTTHPEGQ